MAVRRLQHERGRLCVCAGREEGGPEGALTWRRSAPGASGSSEGGRRRRGGDDLSSELDGMRGTADLDFYDPRGGEEEGARAQKRPVTARLGRGGAAGRGAATLKTREAKTATRAEAKEPARSDPGEETGGAVYAAGFETIPTPVSVSAIPESACLHRYRSAVSPIHRHLK